MLASAVAGNISTGCIAASYLLTVYFVFKLLEYAIISIHEY